MNICAESSETGGSPGRAVAPIYRNVAQAHDVGVVNLLEVYEVGSGYAADADETNSYRQFRQSLKACEHVELRVLPGSPGKAEG